MHFNDILPFVNGDAQSVCAGEFEWPTGCKGEESGVDILPPGAHSVIGDCPFLETKENQTSNMADNLSTINLSSKCK